MSDVAISINDVGISFAITRRRRLKLRELTVHGPAALDLNTFWALRHVNMTIRHGESVGLVGRNGSGKSTLLRLIAGVMLPDEGSIAVNGGIGAMLELSAGFNQDLTGRDNVYLVASLHGFTREHIDEIYPGIVRWSGLRPFMNTQLRYYSSGMKARLGFAVITRLDEPILLIDEALAVGDRAFRRKCGVVMRKQLSEGRTVVLVSHNEADLERFCTRGIYLKDGMVAHDGPMGEVLDAYRTDADADSESDADTNVRAGRP